MVRLAYSFLLCAEVGFFRFYFITSFHHKRKKKRLCTAHCRIWCVSDVSLTMKASLAQWLRRWLRLVNQRSRVRFPGVSIFFSLVNFPMTKQLKSTSHNITVPSKNAVSANIKHSGYICFNVVDTDDRILISLGIFQGKRK